MVSRFSEFGFDPGLLGIGGGGGEEGGGEGGENDEYLSFSEHGDDDYGEEETGGEEEDVVDPITCAFLEAENQWVGGGVVGTTTTMHCTTTTTAIERMCQVPGQSAYMFGGLMCSICSTMLGMCISSGIMPPPSKDDSQLMKTAYPPFLVDIMAQSAR